MRRAADLAPALVLASAPLAQGVVHLVDDDGGADHDQISAAVAAAQDGDTILVLPGVYETFSISGKSISVQATVPGTVAVQGSVVSAVVEDVPLGERVVLRGLSFGDQVTHELLLQNCAGTVWIEQCVIGPGRWIVDACADVVISRCEAQSSTSDGLRSTASSVHAFDSRFRGGDATPPIEVVPCVMIPALPGGAGVRVDGGFLYLSGCELKGGAGGKGLDVGCACGGPSDGGPGLHLATGSPLAYLRDVVLAPGAPGEPACSVSASTGERVLVESGAAHAIHDPARSFEAASPVAAGATVLLEFDGVPGDQVFLLFSFSPQATFLSSCAGSFVLDPLDFVTAFLGTVPASGTLSVSPTVPGVGFGIEAAAVFAQANFVSPDVGCHVSSPSALVITQP